MRQDLFFYDVKGGNSEVIYDRIAGDTRLTISYDSDAVSPREDIDHLWCLSLQDRRYSVLGDKKYQLDGVSIADSDKYMEALKTKFDARLLQPVYMYSHSGDSLRLYPEGALVGYAFVTPESLTLMGVDEINLTLERREESLNAEIDEYQKYLDGEVYMFTEIDITNGNVINAMGNFFGSDFVNNGLVDSLSEKFVDNVMFALSKTYTSAEKIIPEGAKAFSAENFFSDVVYNALSDAVRQSNMDHYSFSDEFIDIIASEISYTSDAERFFQDLSYGGCASGMIGGLIYYNDTKEVYQNHMEDIEDMVSEYEEDLGQKINFSGYRFNDAVWFAFEEFSYRISETFDLCTELEYEVEELSLDDKVAVLNYLENEDLKEVIINQLEESINEFTIDQKIAVFNQVVGESPKETVAQWILDDFEAKEYTVDQLEWEYPSLASSFKDLDIDTTNWLNNTSAIEVKPDSTDTEKKLGVVDEKKITPPKKNISKGITL